MNGNPRNKPSQYETELAKPLDLPGEWDVALINILYPHNWTNLERSYPYYILRQHLNTEDEPSNFVLDAEKNQQELYDVIIIVNVFIRTWEVDRGSQIPRGNYNISNILELIANQFHMVFTNKTINRKIDPYQCSVEINPNVNFAIACYAERTIIKLLGFGWQSTVIDTFQKRAVEYMVFGADIGVQAKLPHLIKRISNMYVYSNIVELSPVGNRQVLITGFFLIKSNFQEMGHWVFITQLNVMVKKNRISELLL